MSNLFSSVGVLGIANIDHRLDFFDNYGVIGVNFGVVGRCTAKKCSAKSKNREISHKTPVTRATVPYKSTKNQYKHKITKKKPKITLTAHSKPSPNNSKKGIAKIAYSAIPIIRHHSSQ